MARRFVGKKVSANAVADTHTCMSRSWWCVMNGRAVAPPAIMFIIGVSTCTQVATTALSHGSHCGAIQLEPGSCRGTQPRKHNQRHRVLRMATEGHTRGRHG